MQNDMGVVEKSMRRVVLPTLRNWLLTWGLLLVAIVVFVPPGTTMMHGWLSLHSVMEIASVAVGVMIFVVGRNALVLNHSLAGALVGAIFLLVAILDTAHLLSFSGMPDFITANHDAKAVTFWLMARFLMATALLLAVSLDWSRREGLAVRRLLLLLIIPAALALVAAGFWLAAGHPELFWAGTRMSANKIAAECLIIAVLVIAFAREIRNAGRVALYRRKGMLSALLTLIAAEWCFVIYETNNDVYIVTGHVFKAIGYYLLYRSLVAGMIREPYRRLAEARLSEKAKGLELEAIFMSAPDGIVVVNADGAIQKVNRRLSELTGYSEAQIKGLSIDVLLPERFRGAHRQRMQNYMFKPEIRPMGAGRDLYARRMDGSEFPVDISLSPLLIDGQRHVIATIRDISERMGMIRQLRDSDNRTRSFLDNSVDWVWESDEGGALRYCSQRVVDLLGITPEKAIGRSLISFMSENDAAKLGPQVMEIMQRREPIIRLDHQSRTSDGRLRIMETSARPHFGNGGVFAGYRGVTRDVTLQRDLQMALEKSERVFRHAFDDFPTGMVFVDCRGAIVRTNAFITQLLAYLPGELETLDFPMLFALEQRWEVSQGLLALCEGRQLLFSIDTRMLGKDGRSCWVRLAAALVDAEGGQAGPMLVMISDIAAEKESARHNQRLLEIIERMGDAVAIAERSGRLLYLNPYGRTMLGIALNEDLGQTSVQECHPEKVGKFIMNRALPQAEKNGVWEGETVWRSRSAEEILTWQVMMVHKDPAGGIEYWTIVARDIRERKLMEERLSYQATHDALTGLPNRLLMRDRLQQAINVARRERKLLAVAFIDLDNFKRVNDTLGHLQGDSVLLEVASRLRETLRASDALARQGGDEFILLLSGLTTVNDVVGITEKVLAALNRPLPVDGREILITGSIGISVFPFDHDSGDELLRKADVAMYRAKERGRNGYQFYTADMDERLNRDLQLEVDLRHAIEAGELSLHYQPKVALESGEVIGFEALLRWFHPQRGMVSPVEFIPVAERSMLIANIGEWVLNEACRQIGVWRREGRKVLPVAVNVSAQQFEYMDVARMVRAALTNHGLEGEILELEITEGVLMHDPLATTRVLAQIKAMGVDIAVDDFGTGYSSLGYLKQFPVDILKIDRSFVVDVPANQDDTAIIRAILSMAHNLGIQVVAEGVETEVQLRFLKECNCDFAQGYYFGKPAPAALIALAPKAVD